MFSIFVLYPPGSGIMIFDIDILLSCCSIWPAKLCFNFLHYVFLFRFLPSRPPNYEFDIYIPLFDMTYPASMFGWWTGHCSKKATRNPGTRKTLAFNMAAGGQSNVHGRGDIQRTTQMRQRHHPFNRTKQFLWGWFNTISSWLVVQCCGSLCGLYSGLYSVLRNSFEPAAAALWSPIAIRSIVATPMCLLGQRLCTLAIREELATSFPGTSLSFFWTWNLHLGRSHLCSMWVKVS